MTEFRNTNFRFVVTGIPTGIRTMLYRMQPARESVEPQRTGVDRLPVKHGASMGVHPSDMMGRYFEVSLSLGTDEWADDIRMEEAVIEVTKEKEIVKTALVGMSGTVKEYINDKDYDLVITVGLVAVDSEGAIIDQYPAEGVDALRRLLDRNEALYVDSEFLRLFGITRFVVKEYRINQATHSNHQVVTISAVSDEDYIIKSNEY